MTPETNVRRWKEILRAGYFDHHAHYRHRRPYQPPFLLEQISVLSPRETCLEIGIGCGRVSQLVAPHFSRMIGCDIADTYFREPALAGVELHVVDGTGALPFADDAFDCVYSMNVMHHLTWDQVLRYIRESQRVTRSGGLLFHYLGKTGEETHDRARDRVKQIDNNFRKSIAEEALSALGFPGSVEEHPHSDADTLWFSVRVP